MLLILCACHVLATTNSRCLLKRLHKLQMDVGSSLDHSLWIEHFRLLISSSVSCCVTYSLSMPNCYNREDFNQADFVASTTSLMGARRICMSVQNFVHKNLGKQISSLFSPHFILTSPKWVKSPLNVGNPNN